MHLSILSEFISTRLAIFRARVLSLAVTTRYHLCCKPRRGALGIVDAVEGKEIRDISQRDRGHEDLRSGAMSVRSGVHPRWHIHPSRGSC